MTVELASAGWNLAILIQTKFEKADVAAGHKNKNKNIAETTAKN
jgi:hypothetical protein